MTGAGRRSRTSYWDLISFRSGFVLTLGIFLSTAGCVTGSGSQKGPVEIGSPETEAVEQELNEQIAQLQLSEENLNSRLQSRDKRILQLQSREKQLVQEISKLNDQLEIEKIARGALKRRFDVAQAARDDAIREVVRIRARIQGMASQAEASAMFAEARVILDRMEEEAFNTEALVDLELARSYMARGKGALENGNPGGAAYLFDLVPGLYEGMIKGDPRMVKVNVSIAALRSAPKSSAPKVGSLYWGDSATGIEKRRDWMKVKASSGMTGWLMKSQIQ